MGTSREVNEDLSFYDTSVLIHFTKWMAAVVLIGTVILVLLARTLIHWEQSPKVFKVLLAVLILFDAIILGISFYHVKKPVVKKAILIYEAMEITPSFGEKTLFFSDSKGRHISLILLTSMEEKYMDGHIISRKLPCEVAYDSRHHCVVGIRQEQQRTQSRKELDDFDHSTNHFRVINNHSEVAVFQEIMTFEANTYWSRSDNLDYVFSDEEAKLHTFFEKRGSIAQYVGMNEDDDLIPGQQFLVTYCVENDEDKELLLDIELINQ